MKISGLDCHRLFCAASTEFLWRHWFKGLGFHLSLEQFREVSTKTHTTHTRRGKEKRKGMKIFSRQKISSRTEYCLSEFTFPCPPQTLTVYPKIKILSSFPCSRRSETRMTFFLILNTKEEILKNIGQLVNILFYMFLFF